MVNKNRTFRTLSFTNLCSGDLPAAKLEREPELRGFHLESC